MIIRLSITSYKAVFVILALIALLYATTGKIPSNLIKANSGVQIQQLSLRDQHRLQFILLTIMDFTVDVKHTILVSLTISNVTAYYQFNTV